MNKIRPKVTDEMIKTAARKVAENTSHVSNKEDLAEAIADVYETHMDGFEIGKALDSEGWSVNTMMVDDLDCMDGNIREIHREVCKRWEVENDIKPPLPIGSIIKEGEITGSYEHEAASYAVKEIGQDDIKCGNRRKIIRFEDAVKLDMNIKTTDDARKRIAEAGITKDNVTDEQLQILRNCICARMIASGNYNGTYRMDEKVSLFMTCSTEQWEGREAVSFNRDDFIGFAGWSDTNNIQPILQGVEDWLIILRG